MTRKTRRAFFWSFFVLFVIVAPPIVLYARGYRFDIAKRKFIATGALFIKSDPSGAFIYLNGIKRGETSGTLKDVLTKPSLIANILPGEYDVRVEKKGYTPWVKKLTVRARQVTEARTIVLFAENNKPKTLLFTPVTDVLISHSGQEAVVIHEGSSTTSLTLVDVASQKPKTLFAERQSPTQRVKPRLDLRAFSPDDALVLFTKEEKGMQTVLIVIDKAHPEKKFSEMRPKSSINTIAFTSRREILFLDEDSVLWKWDIEKQIPPEPLRTSLWGFATVGERLYTLEGEVPMLFSSNEDFKQKIQLTTTPIASPALVDMRIAESFGQYVAFVTPHGEKEGEALLINADQGYEVLKKAVRSVHISPDGKRVLMRTWNELWVQYLGDVLVQPVHKKGDQVLVARFGTAVKDAWWYPASSDYILYTITDGLFATELDPRGGSQNNMQLVRNSDITIRSVTREGLLFTAQDHLAYLSWGPKEME